MRPRTTSGGHGDPVAARTARAAAKPGRRLLLGLLMIYGALLLAIEAQPRSETARELLTRTLGFSAEDLRNVRNRKVIARTLPADHAGEIAVVGVALMNLTPEFYASRLADIANFKKLDAVLQIGTFSDPPQLGDVRGLTLDSSEVRALRECRLHECGLQLPAALIERFRSEIDWRAADAEAKANALLREGLVEHVRRYRESEGREHLVYADQRTAVNVGEAFAALVSSDRLLPLFPQVRGWLLDPRAIPPSTRELVYWSKERAAGRTVLSITHLAIVRLPDGGAADYAAASKQIYASRYFDTSLGFTLLIPEASADRTRTFVVYVNRSQLDTFGGLFGGIARRIVRSRASGGLDDQLERLRNRLEPAFAEASAR